MAQNKSRLKFKCVVICDDIRREDNGKQILIGVYSGNIVVEKFPANLVLSAWLQCTASETGDIPLNLRIVNGEKEAVAGGSGKVHVEVAAENMSLTIPRLLVQVSTEDTLTFQVQQHHGRWTSVHRIGVVLQNSEENDSFVSTGAIEKSR